MAISKFDHGWPWSLQVIYDYGQPWSNVKVKILTMVDHGWSSLEVCLTMVRQFQIVTLPDHGQTWLIHFKKKKKKKHKVTILLFKALTIVYKWLY